MAYKLHITEQEYDKLTWYEQSYYYYCNESDVFILKRVQTSNTIIEWEE